MHPIIKYKRKGQFVCVCGKVGIMKLCLDKDFTTTTTKAKNQGGGHL
jgi:hypothetical protein